MTILEKILAIQKDIGATEQTIRHLKRQLNDAQLKLADLKAKSKAMQTTFKDPNVGLPSHDAPKRNYAIKPIPPLPKKKQSQTASANLKLPDPPTPTVKNKILYTTKSGSRERRVRANTNELEIRFISAPYLEISAQGGWGTTDKFFCPNLQRMRKCVWLTTEERDVVAEIHRETVDQRTRHNRGLNHDQQ